LPEVGRERLRKQKQLDVVSAWRNILFGVFFPVFDDPVPRSTTIEAVGLLLRHVDEVVGAAALLAAPQAAGEGS
jgi:hypothetical protein